MQSNADAKPKERNLLSVIRRHTEARNEELVFWQVLYLCASVHIPGGYYCPYFCLLKRKEACPLFSPLTCGAVPRNLGTLSSRLLSHWERCQVL